MFGSVRAGHFLTNPREGAGLCVHSHGGEPFAMVVAVAGCAENTGPEVELEESEGLAAITNLTFAQISAGSSHSCGRTAVGGRLYCWGYK